MNRVPGWTQEEILDLAKECMFGTRNSGICIECGEEHDGIEPDAREYVCEICGKHAVYGVEELILMGY